MKRILKFVMMLSCGIISAQSSSNNLSQSLNSISNINANNFGAFTAFSNPKNKIEGSVYFFKHWNSKVVIHTLEGKTFTINNINLNLERNTFESKLSGDSLFTFNGIEKFVVNNKMFKNFYYNDDNRVYEIIYEEDDLAIMKGFEIKIINTSSNSKYFQKQSYYVKRDNTIVPFKLNKKALMKLFSYEMLKVAKVEDYIKKDKLSSEKEDIELKSVNKKINKNRAASAKASVAKRASNINSHDNSTTTIKPLASKGQSNRKTNKSSSKKEAINLGSSNNQVFDNRRKTSSETVSTGLSNISSHGASFYFINPKRRVDGTFYLFENWNNNATIYISNAQNFKLTNINLNLKRNTFETKVAEDSLFTFNFNNIDKFVINNKIYKNYYYDEDNRVCEVIFESEEFSLLKGFDVELIEGSANPMVNRTRDKYVRKQYYFLKSDNAIKPFKLRKSRIIKLLGDDPEKLAKIETYIESNRLSFKREKDGRKILEYSTLNQ